MKSGVILTKETSAWHVLTQTNTQILNYVGVSVALTADWVVSYDRLSIQPGRQRINTSCCYSWPWAHVCSCADLCACINDMHIQSVLKKQLHSGTFVLFVHCWEWAQPARLAQRSHCLSSSCSLNRGARFHHYKLSALGTKKIPSF